MGYTTDFSTPHSKSVRRGIFKAIEASLKSDCPNFLVGAVLVKNGNIIGTGWNWFKKSAPDSKARHQGVHAEFHCLRACAKHKERDNHYDLTKLNGATLFVARTTATGRAAMAKPCEYCQAFLRTLNLRKIYYTNREGGISEMVLREV